MFAMYLVSAHDTLLVRRDITSHVEALHGDKTSLELRGWSVGDSL